MNCHYTVKSRRRPNEPIMHCLSRIPYITIFAIIFGLAGTVHAHDPGLSVADVRITDHQIEASLTFARRDIESLITIDTNRDGLATPAEIDAVLPHLRTLANSFIEISAGNRQIAAQGVAIKPDQSDALHFEVHFLRKEDLLFIVGMPILKKLARGHRQYMSVRDKKNNLVAERILNADNLVFEIDTTSAAVIANNSGSFRQFLVLGIEHIVKGYDHLLFLFGLLVVGVNFWSAGRIITSFTVAHSITLALATFNLVQIPPGIVEPLIAVSIIYVGVENLVRRDLHRRWLLTFGFGLVHGLGFASVLRELGVGAEAGGGVIVPLLAFNLGVELGQIAIALLVLPLIWKSQQFPNFFPRLTATCSLLVTLAGTYWLFERTL